MRSIRQAAGITLDDFARWMRGAGYRWTTSRVVELESGEVAATLGTLAGVSSALSGLSGHPVVLVDLLPDSGRIEIARGVVVDVRAMRAWLGGRPWLVIESDAHDERVAQDARRYWSQLDEAKHLRGRRFDEHRVVAMMDQATLADERAAKRLGMSLPALMTVALELWDESLSDARDRRAGEGASPQALGRVTRNLEDEARAHIAAASGRGVGSV